MTYTTIAGDNWDLIAYKVYGTESMMTRLIAANPEHVAVSKFGSGVVLNLPEQPAESATDLPPWKQV